MPAVAPERPSTTIETYTSPATYLHMDSLNQAPEHQQTRHCLGRVLTGLMPAAFREVSCVDANGHFYLALAGGQADDDVLDRADQQLAASGFGPAYRVRSYSIERFADSPGEFVLMALVEVLAPLSPSDGLHA